MAADGSGSVYVVGFETVAGSPAHRDWIVRKYDRFGALLWSAGFGGAASGHDEARAVAAFPSGGAVVAGYVWNGASFDWMVRRYDPGGGVAWTVTYDGPPGANDAATAVAVDPAGNVLVAGFESRPDLLPGQGENWLIRKYSGAGALLWSASYDGPASLHDEAAAVAVDASGSVWVAGSHDRSDLGQDWDWRVAKHASGGALLWSRTYGSPPGAYDLAHAVAVTEDGEAVVAGHDERFDLAQGRNWHVRRYGPDGTLRWTASHDSGGGMDDAYGAAMDPLARPYVAGFQEAGVGNRDWLVRRWTAAGGADWSLAYAGPGGAADAAFALALDPWGAVLVAGSETGASGNADFAVRKWVQPACLDAQLIPSRTAVTVGQWVTLTFSVTNLGGAIDGASVGAWPAGAGAVLLQSGPSPSGTAFLGLGRRGTFTWSFSTSGSGVVVFTATVSGWDPSVLLPAAASASTTVLVQVPPALASALSVSPGSAAVGDAIRVVLTVTNVGEAAAVVAPPPQPAVSGSATAYLALGPVPASATVAGGGAVSFVWIFTAGPVAGTVSFTASAHGADLNSGAPAAAPPASAGPVSIARPGEPCPAAGSALIHYFGPDATGPDVAGGIAVTESGSLFIAVAHSREDVGRLRDIAVIGYPPGGGFLNWLAEDFAPGSVEDAGTAIARTPDGGHVVAVGFKGSRAWIAKFTLAGANVWTLWPAPPGGGPDDARGVAVDAQGNVVVAGRQRRTDLGRGDDVWVAKYSPGGMLLWSLNYDSPASSDDAAFAVAVDASGSVWVAGYETRTDLGTGRDAVVLKYGPDGAGPLLVRRHDGGGGHDEARAVAILAGGGAVAGGFEGRADLGQGDNGWLAAWGPDGTPLWSATFNSPMVRAGGPADRVLGLAVDPDTGDIFAAGREERPGRAADVLLRRYSASGAFLESHLINGPGNLNDEGNAVAVGPGGDVYLAATEDWQASHGQGLDVVIYRWTRPGCLKAALAIAPPRLSTGQPAEVVLTVTNTGATSVTGLTAVLALAGPGSLAYVSGPFPASVASLAAGAVAQFTWQYAGAGAGPVALTGTATGMESVSGLPVSARGTATALIESAAVLAGAASAPASVCAGQVLPLVVTVTNTGQAEAAGVSAPDPPWVSGSGSVVLVAAPAFPLPLAGGASASFTWTYSATGMGSVAFAVTITGMDANSGAAVSTGALAPPPVVVGAPASLAAAAAAPAGAAVGTAFTVTLTVTNAGTGGAALSGTVAVSSAGALAAPLAGPVPAGPVMVAGGTAQSFAWTASVTGWGRAVFTLTAAGSDACGPVVVSATVAVDLGTPAALSASVVAAFPSAPCTGTLVRVVVSVTNMGDVPALNLGGPPPAVSGGGAAALIAGPAPVTSLAGGASVHLTWTFSATAPGVLVFTATVTAADARDGASVAVGPLGSPAVVASAPARLLAAASAPPSLVQGQAGVLTLTITNAGGQDAAGVVPAASASPPGAALLSGASPPGPVAIPPGGSQTFIWTFTAAGAGPIGFGLTVAGTTCGGASAAGASAGAGTVSFVPAALVVTSFVLSPAAVQAPGAVAAALAVVNAGGAPAWIGTLARAVTGPGGLSDFPLAVPFSLTLAGGSSTTFAWTHFTFTPCGTARVTATVTGAEIGTGRALAAGPAVSNAVSIAGPPATLFVSSSSATAPVGSSVTLTARVLDACGLGVPGASVSFAVLAGGGTVSPAVAVTDLSGAATASFVLGPDIGANAAWARLASPALTATVLVGGVHPLGLDAPGAALDRNVLDSSRGESVIARVRPRDDSPVFVKIYTASGRLVRTLRAATSIGGGQYLVEWDGRTEDGAPAARGVYLVRVFGGGVSEVLKVIVR